MAKLFIQLWWVHVYFLNLEFVVFQNTDGEYTWSNSLSVIATFWGPEQPSGGERCVLMKEDGLWYDQQCDDHIPSVCRLSGGKYL